MGKKKKGGKGNQGESGEPSQPKVTQPQQAQPPTQQAQPPTQQTQPPTQQTQPLRQQTQPPREQTQQPHQQAPVQARQELAGLAAQGDGHGRGKGARQRQSHVGLQGDHAGDFPMGRGFGRGQPIQTQVSGSRGRAALQRERSVSSTTESISSASSLSEQASLHELPQQQGQQQRQPQKPRKQPQQPQQQPQQPQQQLPQQQSQQQQPQQRHQQQAQQQAQQRQQTKQQSQQQPPQQQSRQQSQQRPQQSHQQQTVMQQVGDKFSSALVLKPTEMASKPGSAGRVIKIYTNHFELKLGKIKRAIHYDFAVNPDKPKKMMRDVFQAFKQQYFRNYNPAFDGRQNVYSAGDLPFGDEMEAIIVLDEENRKKEFKVRIKKVNVIDLTLINNFINNATKQGGIIEFPMIAVQALDIVLRHTMATRNICVGSSFFSQPTGNIIDLGGGMEMYRGSYQSVSLGWKPFLNVDIANKAFPSAMNLIDLMRELFGRNFNERQPLNQWQKTDLQKFLRNLRVQYEIPGNPSSKRTFRVNEVDNPPNRINFSLNGVETTVLAYFTKAKNYRIKYPEMPCIFVGSKQGNVRLPCELCTLLPGQTVNRKLTGEQTSRMIKHCATSTDVRKQSIGESVRRANYNIDPSVKEFDIHISNEFELLNARVLYPPNILYSRDNVKVRRGVWKPSVFSTAVNIKSWTILNLDGRTRMEDVDKLAGFVTNCGRRMGVNMPPPIKPFGQINFRRQQDAPQLEQYFMGIKKQQVELVFVIINEFVDYIYNYVKQTAELKVGCLTQCLKSKTVMRMNDSTISNILLKVNAKLNGVNHSIEKFDRPKMMDVPTMIMGADVTHPSPDNREVPSVAAVTASFDPKAFKYNMSWRLQEPGQEIIGDLERIVRDQLMYFRRKTNAVPKRLIFYRDGVSDGQFNIVLNAELQAIRKACKSLSDTYRPAITFLVVQKRHHTRFFPANPADSEDRNNNVPAGTCVDTTITQLNRQNFFLVSHASIQGVAKPTKYVTLWDDSSFTNDELETLTYYLCHLFARCTRSVSYPTPTYYAHLAAARAKVYCENKPINLNRLDLEQSRLQIQECIEKDLPMFFV